MSTLVQEINNTSVVPIAKVMYEITCPYCLTSEIAEENFKGYWTCSNCEESYHVKGDVDNEKVTYYVPSFLVR